MKFQREYRSRWYLTTPTIKRLIASNDRVTHKISTRIDDFVYVRWSRSSPNYGQRDTNVVRYGEPRWFEIVILIKPTVRFLRCSVNIGFTNQSKRLVFNYFYKGFYFKFHSVLSKDVMTFFCILWIQINFISFSFSPIVNLPETRTRNTLMYRNLSVISVLSVSRGM